MISQRQAVSVLIDPSCDWTAVVSAAGLFGKGVWEEALHDMIMENVNEAVMAVIDKIYSWRFLNTAPEPEDPAKVAQEVKDKWITILSCIEKVAEKRGAKFIVSDEVSEAHQVCCKNPDMRMITR